MERSMLVIGSVILMASLAQALNNCSRFVRFSGPVLLDPTVSSLQINESSSAASIQDCLFSCRSKGCVAVSLLKSRRVCQLLLVKDAAQTPGPTDSHVWRSLGSEADAEVWKAADFESLIESRRLNITVEFQNSSSGRNGSIQQLSINLTGCYRIEAFVQSGTHGQSGSSGMRSTAAAAAAGTGGSDGQPGLNNPAGTLGSANHGGCGAGWLGGPVNPRRGDNDGGGGGSSSEGWVGGIAGSGSTGNGGFGGGGGAGGSGDGKIGAGGAGGGFSGGGAGVGPNHAGGGGGSYCEGLDCGGFTGGNSGSQQGRVVLQLLPVFC